MTGADTGIYRSLTIWFWVLVALVFVRFLVVLIKKQKAEAIFTGAMVAVFCILYATITYEYDRSVMMICARVFIWCYFLLRLAWYVWKKGRTAVKYLVIIALIATVLFILHWVFAASSPPMLSIVRYPSLEEARAKIGTEYLMPTYYPKDVDPALYDYSDKWNYTATFVFASGTPYTATKDIFIIGGNVICTYEEHNAARLPSYKRLDISAEYCLSQTEKGRHCIDFSLYNALFSKNVLFYYIKVYKDEGKIGRHGLYMFRTCIPSVSYIFKF